MTTLEWMMVCAVLGLEVWFGWYANREQQKFFRSGGDMP